MDGTQYVVDQLGLALQASHQEIARLTQIIAELKAEAAPDA